MPIPHSSIWRIAGSAILAFCAAAVPATLSGRDAGGETQRARDALDGVQKNWMSRIGHKRPGVPGGPGQAEPSDDAGFAARESACLQRIHALCQLSSKSPEAVTPE